MTRRPTLAAAWTAARTTGHAAPALDEGEIE